MRITVSNRVRIQSRYFWEANRHRIATIASITMFACGMIAGGIAIVAWVAGDLRIAGIFAAIAAADLIVDELINNLGDQGDR